ncbi:MAG: DNA polymerase III subunit alpha [Synergistaceae bacterium]|nr:DNA polymerase III subunit alpha [Synergistaceae bacterium]
MKHPFVHLHVHSEYSLLDGAIHCSDLAAQAAQWEMPAVAVTDHGAMFGAVEHYEACRKAGVNPIIGCEIYVDPEGHRSRDKRGRNYHLCLWAADQEGYRNLVKLVSIANTEGFYYKPRIDHDLLARHAKGLIVGSACLAGEIPSLLLEGDRDGAVERALLYRDIVGEGNFYLEVMHNTIPQQALANKELVEISRRTGIPLIATNDAHYLRREDATWHDVLLCIQTNATVDQQDRFRFESDDFYLRSPEEMWQLFGSEIPEALTNTVEIGNRCNVEFTFGQYQFPLFEVPEGHTLETYLEHSAWEGLRSRFKGREIPDVYGERLNYELGVIKQMGFAGYFLIVADFINAAKDREIPVGPGRGSAAGSLVAYAMRITEIDPLPHHLLFERFLNPERISMPDVDTDISDKGRDEVIRYVVEKYGKEKVSQIITFDRMKTKAAIRDVGRALAMPYPDVDRVAKLVAEGVKSVGDALEQSDDLRRLKKEDPAVSRLLDIAAKAEGIVRHCSQHAAGVVIAPNPLEEILPIKRLSDDTVVTQFSMEPVEKLGLVKMDFLGLKNLSLIESCLRNIEGNGKGRISLLDLALDDPRTYELLQRGDTMGVFQLESAGMRQLLKRLKPDCFADLVAVLALYRPGPLGSGMVDQYIERKHGRAPVEYLHPELEEVLKETYGVVLYQEQIMQIAARLAGYSLGEADLLRRAMGKKKADVMALQRDKFVSGCESRGVAKTKAEEIFDIVQVFAGYGFNKSHSAAYALISYQTAYLKANYPVEFLAAFLSNQIGSKMDVLARYVKEVRNAGIEVLPPDVNESKADFTVIGDVIRFGLSAVSKVGGGAVEAILEAREEKGTFRSLWDFLTKIDLRAVNRAVVENLIKVGAFSALPGNRRQKMEVLTGFIEMAQRRHADQNQGSLFGAVAMAEEEDPPFPDVEDYGPQEKLELEFEAVGIYISGHPLDRHADRLSRFTNCSIADLAFWQSEEVPAVAGGLVTSVKERYTRRGDSMGVLEMEDGEGKVEVVSFPRSWPQVKGLVSVGDVIVVRGRLQDRGSLSLIADSILPLDVAEKETPPWLRIRLAPAQVEDRYIKEFFRELKGFPGRSPVLLEIVAPGGTALISLRDLRVNAEAPLKERLDLVCQGAVEIL